MNVTMKASDAIHSKSRLKLVSACWKEQTLLACFASVDECEVKEVL